METAIIKIVHSAILTVTALACWDPTCRMFLFFSWQGTSEPCAGINNSISMLLGHHSSMLQSGLLQEESFLDFLSQ